MIATALSIAGSDPSGGAGIQADLKSFSACGVYGMTVITALTAQNTRGVTAIELPTPDFVRAQLDAVFDDVRVEAIKIGMIANAAIADTVASSLEERAQNIPVVLDPVMIAKGGAKLLEDEAIRIVRDRLVPLATTLTPNLPEAATLLGRPTARTRAEMSSQAEQLLALGCRSVLLKGGHLEGPTSPDLLLTAAEEIWYDAPRVPTANTHGTGCTLSASLAAELAKGNPLPQAVRSAKAFVAAAITGADALHIGSGHGPTHHFHALWSQEDG